MLWWGLQALLLARIDANMAGNKELADSLVIPANMQEEAIRCLPCNTNRALPLHCQSLLPVFAMTSCASSHQDRCSEMPANNQPLLCVPASFRRLLMTVLGSCILAGTQIMVYPVYGVKRC